MKKISYKMLTRRFVGITGVMLKIDGDETEIMKPSEFPGIADDEDVELVGIEKNRNILVLEFTREGE